MQAGEFSDEDFFRTLAASGARALLIGRRALILLGAPVMTADYDLWVHIDDSEKLNEAFRPLDQFPSRTPQEARQVGRYVLENGERIDVIVARAASTPDGETLDFDSAWKRRQDISIVQDLKVAMPCLADLVMTKRWGSRPKDILDIQAAMAELDGPEGEDLADYVAWFLRRYPTPLERLRYARRKYEEAMHTRARVLGR